MLTYRENLVLYVTVPAVDQLLHRYNIIIFIFLFLYLCMYLLYLFLFYIEFLDNTEHDRGWYASLKNQCACIAGLVHYQKYRQWT